MNETIANWERHNEKAESALRWTNYIVHIPVMVYAAIVIHMVVFYYKRREVFLIGIPTIFFLVPIGSFTYMYLYLNDSSYDSCSGEECPLLMSISSEASLFLFNMGHLFFAT